MTLPAPSKAFSFTDWARTRPQEPPPGDRLDAAFAELRSALIATQRALSDLRRDDGQLRNASVGAVQLQPELADDLAEVLKLTQVNQRLTQEARDAVTEHAISEQNIELLARDAERAAVVSRQNLTACEAAALAITDRLDGARQTAARTESTARDAISASNYAEALSDNAEKFKDEALQWAEYLAGPVVNSADAPAYIAASPFPHGLYYQPVEGYGGTGGLWSAKWWAIWASQLIGPWASYYLGPWASAPYPGQRNSDTGQVTPTPIGEGSFFYNTTSKTFEVWDGVQWIPAFTLASGFQARYAYIATAGQTTFSGADLTGKTPVVGDSPSNVHVNGVQLLEVDDYAINKTTNTLTFTSPLYAGALVQWDLLVPTNKLAPVAANIYKTIVTGTINGTNKNFTLTYNPGTGMVPVNTNNAAQLVVCLDGIVQEPTADYTIAANALNFTIAPQANSHLWVSFIGSAV